MSFQTVLSIVGVAFSAFEMYKRFRPKVSSPRAEPKQSGGDRESGEAAGAKLEATSKNLRNVEERSAVSSKIGIA